MRRFRRSDESDLVSLADLRRVVDADAAVAGCDGEEGPGRAAATCPASEAPVAAGSPGPGADAGAGRRLGDRRTGTDRGRFKTTPAVRGDRQRQDRDLPAGSRLVPAASPLGDRAGARKSDWRRRLCAGLSIAFRARLSCCTRSSPRASATRSGKGSRRASTGWSLARVRRLFAPVQNLGLIVLDEEHENTYKQDSEPRYHARMLAGHLAARMVGAVVVLGQRHAERGIGLACRARRLPSDRAAGACESARLARQSSDQPRASGGRDRRSQDGAAGREHRVCSAGRSSARSIARSDATSRRSSSSIGVARLRWCFAGSVGIG